ncbi:MAG TPA: Wzt carbohydrate-binding domain-containing protein [Burkholderiales bacterium]|nr:Wzt carbohydrate-binding domain-containing protein [Burkholderiales bacterium]
MTIERLWPVPEAFLDIAMVEEVTDGRARCTSVAICDAEGNPLRSFYQGQAAHFFYEFEILDKIGVPCGGLEFHNSSGLVIHGKNSFQYDVELPRSAESGQRLRYHQVIHLDVGPGYYWFTVGFASTDEVSYQNYSSGAIGHEQFAPLVHCRVVDVASFIVQFDEQGKLRHHGVANLQGHAQLTVIPSTVGSSVQHRKRESAEEKKTTIIHVTHWKAGSQWIHRILNECVPDLVVTPRLNQTQFLTSPIQLGKVYPTVYVTKAQFDRTHLPPNTRRFVVIRDLRDTLVSAYFSMKISHPALESGPPHLRTVLQSLSQEDGMLYMIEEWLPPCADIQTSWLEADEPLIRYEDLLEHDLAILEAVLLDRCQLPVARAS